MLPSIARRLKEADPASRYVAFIEVDAEADEQALSTDAHAEIHWVYCHGAESGASPAMEDALRRFEFPAGHFFNWAGGEAKTLRSIRCYLIRERGVNPDLASFSGHWKRGVADHDHHEPIKE